jgi:hypothetical protein
MAIHTNSIVDSIMVKLQNIPSEQQRQVLDYVEFIAEKYASTSNPSEQLSKNRILGLHEGKIWISDDFNDPLSDEFWGDDIFERYPVVRLWPNSKTNE